MTLPEVAGLDPSLTASGIAWPDGRCVKVGKAGITAIEDWAERGQALKSLVLDVASRTLSLAGTPEGVLDARNTLALPKLIVMEGLDFHNARASAGLLERSYLWLSLLNLFTLRGIPVLVVNLTTLKKYATGTGNAAKSAVVEACARRLPQFETKGDDNRADAAWLCAIGCAMLGHPLAELPAANRAALEKLTLPEALRNVPTHQP